MIIQCINCNKKFNVDADLIPKQGRQIQCGSCKHIWHFKIESSSKEPLTLEDEDNQTNLSIAEGTQEIIESINLEESTELLKDNEIYKENKIQKNTTTATNIKL